MNSSYLSYVFELSLYYLLLIMSLPLVYAVTYHLSFSSMYTSEWLMISVFLSPLVLSICRYSLWFCSFETARTPSDEIKQKILEKVSKLFKDFFIKPPNQLKFFLLQLESLQHIVVGVFKGVVAANVP